VIPRHDDNLRGFDDFVAEIALAKRLAAASVGGASSLSAALC
jgi:hypothetical protein